MERRVQFREVRADESNGKRTIRGYAATYNTLSKNLGNFVERIAPGAFDRILRAAATQSCVCLLNHDENKILGRVGAGTLRLSSDKKGLRFECDLPNTATGDEVWSMVRRGDLNGCSFAFRVDDGTMCDYDEEDVPQEGVVRKFIRMAVRTIRDFAGLFDVSIVTNPAYPGTSVAARNIVAAEVRSHVEKLATPKPVVKQDDTEQFIRRTNLFIEVLH
jgi:uncharacterized protein